MAKFVTCKECNTRYKLLRLPESGQLACKKCGGIITFETKADETPAPVPPAQPAKPAAQKPVAKPQPEPEELPVLQPASPPKPQPDYSGRTIAGYRFIKRVEQGETSDLYKAQQVAMGRTVSVRVPHETLAANPAELERFLEDARVAATLHHAAIVSIYDVNTIDVPFYSMESLEGASVTSMLKKMGLPPSEDAVRITLAVGGAVAHAIRVGVAGISVTHDTVMVTSKGEPKLLPSAFSAKDTPDSEAACIKQLGLFLYKVLTGSDAQPNPRPPSTLNAQVPASLDDVVLKMIQGQRKGFETVAEAMQAVRHACDNRHHSDALAERMQRSPRGRQRSGGKSKKKVLLAGGLAVACAVCVIAVVLLVQGHKGASQRYAELSDSYTAKRYTETIELAEAFLSRYPKHEKVDTINEWIEKSREGIAVQARLDQLQAELNVVLSKASESILKLPEYEAEIKEIATGYEGVPGAQARVQTANVRLNIVWQTERDRRHAEFSRNFAEAMSGEIPDPALELSELQRLAFSVRGRDFGRGYKLVDELETFYRQTGQWNMSTMQVVDRARNQLFEEANKVFTRISNRQNQFLEEELRGELIKAYETIINDWGEPRLVENAERRLTQIKPREEPVVNDNEEN